MQEFLQVLLQLVEVDGGDESLAGFGQAVPGQLGDLVVDEAQDAIGQRVHVLRRVGLDEVRQALLHLSRGLQGSRGTELKSHNRQGSDVMLTT